MKPEEVRQRATVIINVADIIDPDDPAGRTYRQINAQRKHRFPIGALLEIAETGTRAFVVRQTRDCDQTPMYSLCLDPDDESLRLIHLPDHYERQDGYLVLKAEYRTPQETP